MTRVWSVNAFNPVRLIELIVEKVCDVMMCLYANQRRRRFNASSPLQLSWDQYDVIVMTAEDGTTAALLDRLEWRDFFGGKWMKE